MSDTADSTMTPSSNMPGPLTLDRAKELVHEFCKTYPVAYAIGYRIRATQEELYGPNASRANIGATIYGAYIPATADAQRSRPLYRGRCDIAYASFSDDATLRRTLAHEITGHFGLNTLSVHEKRAVLDSIAQSRGQTDIDALWSRAQKNYPGQSDSQIAEEVYASVAEIHHSSAHSAAHPAAAWHPHPPTILTQLNQSGAQTLSLRDLTDIVAHVATGLHDRSRDQRIFPQNSRAQFSLVADVGRAEITEVERSYGGRAAYDTAHAAGATKLNYEQWLQVRTPSFKQKFGDWEGLNRQTHTRALIGRALSDRNWQERTLLVQGHSADPSGKLSQAFGFAVEKQYITPDDIRKTDKKHGLGNEKFPDQLGMTPDDYVKALEILRDPESFRLTTSKNKKPSAEFGRQFSDGTYVVAEVEVSEAGAVSIKTAWKKLAGRNHANANIYPVRTTPDNAAKDEVWHSDRLLVNPATVSTALDPVTKEPMAWAIDRDNSASVAKDLNDAHESAGQSVPQSPRDEKDKGREWLENSAGSNFQQPQAIKALNRPIFDPNRPFHEVVAETLIAQIEAGTAPWQKPWDTNAGVGGMPMNPVTGKRYKGINAIHLMSQGRSDARWMTYKQAADAGAQVRRGERGTSIQYWQFEATRTKKDDNGKPQIGSDGRPEQEIYRLEKPRVFFANVFNGTQIDGLPPVVAPVMTWEPIEQAQRILANSGAVIVHSASDTAYYSPARDEIHLPTQSQFPSAAHYYGTALHELGHWTGHESRLKRDLKHPFGSEGYAREELRAEIASLLVSTQMGLPHDPQQHAAYVGNWVSVLKKDPLEIFRAAADADRIYNFLDGLSVTPALEQGLGKEMAPAINQSERVQFPKHDDVSAGHKKILPDARVAALEMALPESPLKPASSPVTPITSTTKAPMATSNDRDLTTSDVSDALSYISANMPRDDWARIGMAIKSEFSGEEGFQLFDQWSQTGDSYDARAAASTWKSIKAGGAVTVGTLIRQAQDNGFKFAAPAAPVQRTVDDAAAAAAAAAKQAEAQERQVQHKEAAGNAQRLLQTATFEQPSPYTDRKGVGAHGTWTSPNGELLVPLVDDQGQMWNLQRILPQKMDNGNDKLFLKGGRKSGLFHVIGDMARAEHSPIVVAEGYATAASLHEATGWPVVVSFDAGNLARVATTIRQLHPSAALLIAGDDDRPTQDRTNINPGRDKATEAAAKVSAALAFPNGLQSDGTDFNDLVAQLGQEAGAQRIRESLRDGLVRHIEGQAQADKPAPGLEQAKGGIQSLQALQHSDAMPAQALPEQIGEAAPPVQAAPALKPADAATADTPVAAPVTAADVPAQDAPQSQTASEAPALNMQPVLSARAAQMAKAREDLGLQQPIANSVTGDAIGLDGSAPTSPAPNAPQKAAPKVAASATAPASDLLQTTRQLLANEFQFDGAGKYFFRGVPGSVPAFADNGKSLDTSSHSAQVTGAIAQLAKAKGWTQITLRGTPEFKQEMWLQAQLQGIKKVHGYEAQPIDFVRLQERLAVLATDAQNLPKPLGEAQSPQPQQTPQGQPAGGAGSAPLAPPTSIAAVAAQNTEAQLRAAFQSAGANEPAAVDLAVGALRQQLHTPRAYVGTLLAHGQAPYKFNPEEKGSYFARLQTAKGEQTVWGIDLPRAIEPMEKSGSAVGKPILLAFQGSKPVTVLVPQKTIDGKEQEPRWETVERNTWFAQTLEQAYAQGMQGPSVVQPELAKPAVSAPPAQATTPSGPSPVSATAPAPAEVPKTPQQVAQRSAQTPSAQAAPPAQAAQTASSAATAQPHAPSLSLREAQALEVLTRAMQIANVPPDIASETLKLATSALRNPQVFQLGAQANPSGSQAQPFAAPTVAVAKQPDLAAQAPAPAKKMGPSL